MGSMITQFLNRWRQGGTQPPQPLEYAPAPGTAIRYSPSLVDELKADHREFFVLHRRVIDAVRGGRLETVPALLQRFDALLTAHLLTEQVRLYSYLDGYFSADAPTRAMLRDYRLEMERIGNSVRQLIKKYRNLAGDRSLQDSIDQDMEELRQVLDERMSREELTLYPLYMPVTN